MNTACSLEHDLVLPEVETDTTQRAMLFFIFSITPTDSTVLKSVLHLTKHVTISKALMLKLLHFKTKKHT